MHRMVIFCIIVCLLTACRHFRHEDASTFDVTSSGYNGLVSFYRGPLNHLSAVRRGSCPMYPSCSEYSRQAVADHGPLIGWIMTIDRLLRCGRNELDTAQRIFVNGQWKFYDPLWANDGWWRSSEDNDEVHTPLIVEP